MLGEVLSPRQQARAFGYVSMGDSLGTIGGPVIAGLLAEHGFSSRCGRGLHPPLPCPQWRHAAHLLHETACQRPAACYLRLLVSWRLVHEASSPGELARLVCGTLHRFKKSWCCCRPYLLPCLVVAIFGLATGAFCTVYMPETLPEAQLQRSSELLPKWLQPRSDYQALMSDEAGSPLIRVKQRRPPRPSKHTITSLVLAETAMLLAGTEMRRLSK